MPKQEVMEQEKEYVLGEEAEQTSLVSIKPGVFDEAAVGGWFRILEAQFTLNKITKESTKFYHVVAALPSGIIGKISDDVMDKEEYTLLKKTIVDIYERTKPELFEQLISKTSMTGRPSVFLQELRSIAAKVGVRDDLVRHKFLNALPSTVAPVLATQKDSTLLQLGSLADELMPLLNNNYQTNAISHYQNKPKIEAKQDKNIPYGLRPYKPDQKPKVCKSHLYYADFARTCKPWCKWPNKRNCRIAPSSRSSSPSPSVNRNSEN